MFRLALRTLRHRTGGFAATFVALFFGAALVMACGGLLETGVRSDVEPQRLAGADLVITGEQRYEVRTSDEDTDTAILPELVRLDRGQVSTVADLPGVAAAIGDRSFPVAVASIGTIQGHPWTAAALTPYRITEGAPPTGSGQVVSTGGVAVGQRLTVQAQGRTGQVVVTGLVAPTTPVDAPAMFFGGADSGPVDAIGVIATSGTDLGQLRQRIETALAGTSIRVLAGSDRGLAEWVDVQRSGENLIVLAAVIGGFSILVAMFVVASTLGLSIQQRQREMALLRAIGTTPRQLRRMVLGETLVVAVVATALAWVPGMLLGRWLFDRLTGLGVVPDVVEFSQGPIPMVVGVGAGLLTALIAGYMAARRAGSARPTEALADAAIQRRWLSPTRLIGALLCFGGGTALAIVTVTVFTGPIAASTAGPSVMLWAIGLAFIAPGLTRVMTAVLSLPLRMVSGMAGRLAMLNARAHSVRLAAAVTPIMLATGVAVANLYLQTTQVHAAEEAFGKSLRADVVLTSTTGGLPHDLIDRIRQAPGVAGASEFVTSSGFIESPSDGGQSDDGWPLEGLSADGAAATTVVDVTAGRLTDLTGNSVALPVTEAGALGLGVGDTITVRLGDRSTVDLRIVALYNDVPGYEKILLPVELLAAHTTGGLPSRILVTAAPGVSPAALTTTLTTLTAGLPGATVADRAALTEAFADQEEIQASVNYLMVGMIMAYTAISVVNTLVMATGRRRREFGLQRLTGSTRGQVMRMMGVEAVLVAGIGIGLGTLVSTTTLVPFSLVVLDRSMPYGPLWIYLGVAGLVGLLAMAATLIPTWFATRGRPAEAVAVAE